MRDPVPYGLRPLVDALSIVSVGWLRHEPLKRMPFVNRRAELQPSALVLTNVHQLQVLNVVEGESVADDG